MKTETSNTILSFIENNFDKISFQNWLFQPETETNIGNQEFYEELILLNYSSNSAALEVSKLVNKFNLIKTLHLNSIKLSLNKIIDEGGNPYEELENLNKWADKGYTFLGEIDAIGNLGEQGKSLVYDINRQMNSVRQFQILNDKHKGLKEELTQMLKRIENKNILLTGKSRELKGFGKIYEFTINE